MKSSGLVTRIKQDTFHKIWSELLKDTKQSYVIYLKGKNEWFHIGKLVFASPFEITMSPIWQQ
jgi:hypothetical protein